MYRLIAIIALSVGLLSSAKASSYGPLVTAVDLSTSINQVSPVLLDIRGKAYEEAHAVGAISAPYGLFRGPKENPGQLVDINQLEADLETLGLQLSMPIVIISNGKTSSDFGAAARVYWTLKSTGFTDLAILNGGHQSWIDAGLPVEADARTLAPSSLELSFSRTWLANTEAVAKVVEGKASAILVDARLAPFYAGDKSHPAAKQPGTLPGSINQAFTTFFEDESPAISPIGDVAALKASLGVSDGQDVISFCNTGHWAASHWFAVSELGGVANAKLYPGSMVEYSNADLPMENTPGLLQNLVNQITK